MRDPENLPRLFEADDAPAELRMWLRRAHDDVPSEAETEELIRSVETRMAAPGAGLGGVRPARARHTVRVVAGLAILGIGIGGWYLAVRSDPSERPVTTMPALRPTTASASAVGKPVETTPSAAAAPIVPVDEHALAPTATRVSQPRVARARGKEPETVRQASVDTTPQPVPAESPDEFALLRAARQAIADRPAKALDLTEQHARRFPTGMLAQEREAIAVEALAKLGRAPQAKARAKAFLSAHPDSPYKTRIDAALSRISGLQPGP